MSGGGARRAASRYTRIVERQIRRILLLGLGWALVLFGGIGLFLPVLQGVLFILLGLYVLSRESAVAHRMFERLRARYPKIEARMHRLKDRLRNLWPAWSRRKAGDDADGSTRKG